MNVVGTVDVIATRIPLVQVDAPEIDHPEQRWQIVDDREVDDVPGAVRARARAGPLWTRDRNGSSFGGRWPCRIAPASGTYGSSKPAVTHRSINPPRLMSPRPTKCT